MKVTLKQVLDAVVALEALGDKELPIDLSFLVSRLTIKLRNEARPFPESRLALFDKHGHQIEGGVEILPKKRLAYQADLNALLNREIEIGEIDPLSWPEIRLALNDQTFKGNHILAMEWLLDFEENGK